MGKCKFIHLLTNTTETIGLRQSRWPEIPNLGMQSLIMFKVKYNNNVGY